jgi:hypothetical protein
MALIRASLFFGWIEFNIVRREEVTANSEDKEEGVAADEVVGGSEGDDDADKGSNVELCISESEVTRDNRMLLFCNERSTDGKS